MRLGDLVLLPLVLLVCGAAAAQTPAAIPSERLAAQERQAAEDAKLWNANPAPQSARDFSGVWWATRYIRDFRRLDGSMPPMTPLGQSTAEYKLRMIDAGTPVADASSQCYPLGVPRIMTTPYPVEFVHSPGLITILVEYSHVIRLVHMDKAAAPAGTTSTFSGYSVGRWDGDTLVITTTHLSKQGTIDQTSLTHGPNLTVTERITKFTDKYGGVNLRNRLTIDDPDYYTEPWTAERIFNWRGDIRLMEYSCEENNRNKPENGVTGIQ
jgi:hypothetical protein